MAFTASWMLIQTDWVFVFVLITCFEFTYLSKIGSLQVFFEAGSYYFWNCDLQEAWSTVKHRPWTKQAQDLNSIFATYCTGSMSLQATETLNSLSLKFFFLFFIGLFEN